MRKHLLLLIFSLALPTGLLAGNTWQTATAIAEGETLSGTMDKNDTEEWYKIVIPKDGDVTLNVKTDATLVMSYVELHAKANDTALGSWGYKYLNEAESPFTVSGVAPGTYYVHLKRQDGYGGYSLKYTFTPENYANDTEPNNEWKQASTTLVSGETIQGHLGYDYWYSTDKDDWYKIVVPADGDVTFDVKTDETLVIRYVELHAKSSDTDLGSWGYKYLNEAEAPFTVSGVAPGTYYVHLNHESGYGGYSLKYTFTPENYANDTEPNNEWKQASTTLVSGETIQGHLGYDYWSSCDQNDWYKIVVPADGDVTFDVKTDATLVMSYVELHAKANDTALGSWGHKYLNEAESPFTVSGVAPGTYYVHLKRQDGYGGYSLKYTFTPENYANDTEPNNEWKQASTTLVSGETIQGHLGYDYWSSCDQNDWYKIVVPADGDVTFDVKTDETLVMSYVELHAKANDTALGSWGYKFLNEAESPFTVNGVAPGTYYVHLNHESGYGGYSLKYTFTRNFYPNDAGPNDNWKQAVTLKKDKTVSGHLGYDYWSSCDHTDWYKINLKQTGSIELHITTDKASPLVVSYVELYKASGDNVSSIKYEFQNEEFKPVIVNDLAPGTYYVKVERQDKYGTYFLVWGSTLKLVGDVNDDGKVTAADAKAVADYIMGNTPAGFNIMMADVNEDGKINAVDVTSIIGIINKK